MSGLRVAVAGATGAVGREILSILAQRKFPASEVIPLASERSEGSKIPFAGGELTVRRLGHDSFEGVQLALFSAGASRSLEFAPTSEGTGWGVWCQHPGKWKREGD